MKILISGTSSGLGKYLYKNIKSKKFIRDKKKIDIYRKKWDVIIHCGFYVGDNKKKLKENTFWSKFLTKLSAKKYIFISSSIVLKKKKNLYALSKIESEKIFKAKKNSTIIRLASIFGNPTRKNTIYKILFFKKPIVGVSAKSKYTFVSYNEILYFINLCIHKNISGTFNFLRNDLTSLKKISNFFNKKTKFGNIDFKCVVGKNKKVLKYYNLNNESSLQVLKKTMSIF